MSAPEGEPIAERWHSAFVIASIAAFSVSLTQPAFGQAHGASANSIGPALVLLLEGWRALPRGYFECFANPFLMLSWVLAVGRRPISSLIAACVAATLMLLFARHREFTLAVGYWLWLGSGLLMVAAASTGAAAAIARKPFPPPTREIP